MISIDWGTKVITVPKSYTSLISLIPFETRLLDINQFRLDLRGLEADVEGMPHLRTHIHNTEVIVGGVVLARVISIVNGYTLTFEDGSYAVNLDGANSNLLDVANLNSVQIRSANSAGLIVTDGGTGGNCDETVIAEAVWNTLVNSRPDDSFGQLLIDLLSKSSDVQHTINLNTELLKNKPNNPNP